MTLSVVDQAAFFESQGFTIDATLATFDQRSMFESRSITGVVFLAVSDSVALSESPAITGVVTLTRTDVLAAFESVGLVGNVTLTVTDLANIITYGVPWNVLFPLRANIGDSILVLVITNPNLNSNISLEGSMEIKEGSTIPVLLANPTRDGVPVPNIDLASTITFVMRDIDTPSFVVSGLMTVNDTVTAEVQYDWVVGDTDHPGEYNAEIIVVYPGGGVEIFPNDGYERVTITPAV